ncbi:MAG: TonB-dependent receptor, partial [bacterium]|nr:TonB-dependent receptor [bacterium]
RFWDGDGADSGLTHSFNGNFTRIQGRHNLKFGASFRAYRSFGNRFPYATSPFFRFRGRFARGPLDNSPNSPHGQDLAELLLGLPAEGFMEMTPSYAMNGPSLGIYIHDDFRLTPKLTLNLGLRWEYDLPVTERFDRLVASFAGDSPNPIEAEARANYANNPIPELSPEDFRVMGGLTWVGGAGRSPFLTDKSNFMPRIGLAYQLTTRTVLRAGVGLFYDTVGVNQTNPIQTGYSQSTPVQVTRDGGETFVTRMSDPFPNGLLIPQGSSGGLLTNLNQSVQFYRNRRHNPYSQRWSLGLQQLLPANFLVEASYVGNRGTRLPVVRELNATPAEWLSTSFNRDQETIDFLSERLANPFQGTDPIFGSKISRADLLKPYPQFGSVAFEDGAGYSWYHSMQLRAEKRFSHGFTFQISYTFSKLMQAVEFLNNSDPMPYETLAGTDRPHIVSATGVWELPFGRGRRFGADMPAVLNGIVGGWQLGMVMRHQSGSPLEFGDAIFNGNIKDIALPNSQRTVNRWFNTDAGFNR